MRNSLVSQNFLLHKQWNMIKSIDFLGLSGIVTLVSAQKC